MQGFNARFNVVLLKPCNAKDYLGYPINTEDLQGYSWPYSRGWYDARNQMSHARHSQSLYYLSGPGPDLKKLNVGFLQDSQYGDPGVVTPVMLGVDSEV